MITQAEAVDFVRRSVTRAGLAARSVTIGETFTAEDADGMPTVHVVNYESGSQQGWIMVSGDQRIMPLLAYGYDEPMTTEAVASGGIDQSFGEYAGAVEGVRTGTLDQNLPPYDIEAAPQPCDSDASSPDDNGNCPPPPPSLNCDGGSPEVRRTTGPLMPSRWDQRCPSNLKLPWAICSDNCGNQRPAAGCVPIATAQILNFYEVTPSFDYDNILNNYIQDDRDSELALQDGDVADLVRFTFDQSAAMQFGCQSTGAIPDNIPFVFAIAGFTSTGVKRDYRFADIRNEIDAGRPVVMQGRSGRFSDWHVWVVDGHESIVSDCDTEFYQHMNWGWGGTANGWYLVGNWQPVNQDEDRDPVDPDVHFSYYKKTFTNIQP